MQIVDTRCKVPPVKQHSVLIFALDTFIIHFLIRFLAFEIISPKILAK